MKRKSVMALLLSLSMTTAMMGYGGAVASDGCAKENPVRIRNDAVTVYGSCFQSHWETGKGER